ncbi:unnamed protein product [Gemmata massiliana]|uniref:Uncharacterized protein n=1 Tax=Gemmata massiliana TaxID=1210884 RepID=A0A6P2CSF0_9BACT|nr:hypothetical protein [Gemmata massiliana]VTR91869.1 unnamed protein product [Gemmata massiliana]
MTTTALAPATGEPIEEVLTDEEQRAKLLDKVVTIGDLLSRVWRLDDDMCRAGYGSPFGDEYNDLSNDLKDAVFAYVRALGRG